MRPASARVTREPGQPGEHPCSPPSSRVYARGNLHQNSEMLQGQLVWNPRDQASTSERVLAYLAGQGSYRILLVCAPRAAIPRHKYPHCRSRGGRLAAGTSYP